MYCYDSKFELIGVFELEILAKVPKCDGEKSWKLY